MLPPLRLAQYFPRRRQTVQCINDVVFVLFDVVTVIEKLIWRQVETCGGGYWFPQLISKFGGLFQSGIVAFSSLDEIT